MWGGLLIRRTKVEDAGMYKCTAKTLSDEDIPNVYRGAEIKIDVLCKSDYIHFSIKSYLFHII